jgi:dUTP pyrophosphatase
VRLANCVGVIDSDYRGEIMVVITNDDIDRSYKLQAGERIVQACIERVEPVTFTEVDELAASQRGAGGFGSTGLV